MDQLYEKHHRKIRHTTSHFVRGIMNNIRWDARLIGIRGARGVGKTTLLLQYLKNNFSNNNTALYISLDNIWFAENSLNELADDFVKKGGTHLFLDEVHKYPDWSQEIKNIYDDYPDIKIVFTGSSLLEILNARADLSRRAVVYTMQGLSYREFLNIKLNIDLPIYSLDDILHNHTELAIEVNNKIKPLQYFSEYLNSGYYPFFQEIKDLYFNRIEEIINMTLEIELPLLRKVDISYVPRLKQLLQIISESVPFLPNISKLSERIGINRNTLITYLYFLQESNIIKNLYKDSAGITKLQKPDKIFIDNTNLIYTFSPSNANKGNLRETFFVNQVSYLHNVEYSQNSDFIVNSKYTFEIGGQTKATKQIKNIKNSFIVADDIEYGHNNKIPLWLFGFLY